MWNSWRSLVTLIVLVDCRLINCCTLIGQKHGKSCSVHKLLKLQIPPGMKCSSGQSNIYDIDHSQLQPQSCTEFSCCSLIESACDHAYIVSMKVMRHQSSPAPLNVHFHHAHTHSHTRTHTRRSHTPNKPPLLLPLIASHVHFFLMQV